MLRIVHALTFRTGFGTQKLRTRFCNITNEEKESRRQQRRESFGPFFGDIVYRNSARRRQVKAATRSLFNHIDLVVNDTNPFLKDPALPGWFKLAWI